MIPEPITLNGRTGTVVYLDAHWHPTTPDEASMARVLFDDGGTGFFTTSPVQSIAPGVGGVTRKFDESKHPRDKDGRFAEATAPRIFNRPEEIGQSHSGWANDPPRWAWIDKETGKPGGRLLTGEPIPREQLPETLYHVTTAGPAVEASGVLLGLLESGGLGGGQAEGVSFTTSPEDAHVIQRELKRAVLVARGEATIEDLEIWARADEREAGLPTSTLQDAVGFARDQWEANQASVLHTFVWDDKLPEDQRGYVGPPPPPEELERLQRSSMGDALKAYLQLRGHHDTEHPTLKNPILFGRQEYLAKLHPDDIQTLEIPSSQIPAGALVTTGSDSFLHEVRAYSDVPLRRKIAFDEAKHPREPKGTGEGGQFTETGHGQPTPDPLLAVQAKAGITAVATLLPTALKTANYDAITPRSWDDIDDETQQKVKDRWREDEEQNIDPYFELHDWAREELRHEKPEVVAEKAVKAMITEVHTNLGKTIKDESVNLLYVAGRTAQMNDALQFSDDSVPTPEELASIKESFHRQYEAAFTALLEERLGSGHYDEAEASITNRLLEENWDSIDDDAKLWMLREKYHLHQPIGRREPEAWVTGIEDKESGGENYAKTGILARQLTVLRTDQLRQERGLTGPQNKPTFTVVDQSVTHGPLVKPNFVIYDAAGVLVGASNTEKQALLNAEEWAQTQSEKAGNLTSEQLIGSIWTAWKRESSDGLGASLQLAAARELGGHHRMTPEEVAKAEAEAESYGGMATLQAYVRAQWEVTQFVLQKAKKDHISVYRGLMLPGEKVNATPQVWVDKMGDPIPPPTDIERGGINPPTGKPYVRFKFNGEQFVVEKERPAPKSILDIEPHIWPQVHADQKKQVFDLMKADAIANGLTDEARTTELVTSLFSKLGDDGRYHMLQDYIASGRMEALTTSGKPIKSREYETDEEAIDRRLTQYLTYHSTGMVFTKLPEIVLQRAGAQSTTGTPSVANDWGGVGNLPDDPTRVVLRIEAPATSVLSVPVYGENSQEEHETVVVGTTDTWRWDAWKDRAPVFASQPIATARKSEPLVIDLQAEDRGKPHWMSSVDWASVLKWDETQHPRDTDGRFTEAAGTATAQPDAGAGGSGGVGVPTPTPAQKRPAPNPASQAVANAYNAQHGLPPVQHGYVTVDEPRAGRIADVYEALPKVADDPATQAAYAALGREVQAQWDHIVASGVTFEPWTKEGQPYQSSVEMANDVRQNQHLFFFTGGEPHPYLGTIDSVNGLSLNDKLRAVHDYFGHTAGGYGFGARGEENAWLSHAQMFTPEARRAMTSETRGQNSWVNFGRHNYYPDGTYKHIPPAERPYAPQKTALLPDEFVLRPGETVLKGTGS